MKKAAALMAFSILVSSAHADGLLPPKATEVPPLAVIEIKMPNGTTQKGLIRDGVFIPIQDPSKPDEPAAAVPVQGSVKVTAPQVDITQSTVELHSRLRKTYTGYAFVISNNSQVPIELLHGEVINGVNGQGAALGAQKSSAAAIGTTIGTGVVTGFLTLGISTAASLVASPIIYGANKHKNTKTIGEGVGFSNQVPIGALNPGDNAKFSTLVPISQKPQLKVTFKEISSNEIFSVSK